MLSDARTFVESGFKLNLSTNLAPFELQIQELFRKSSLSDYPSCEAVLFKHQPFAYFNEQANANRDYWKESWLDKVTYIGNDSKHIRLTPQHIKDELIKSFGTIRLQKMKIQIEYIESDLFTWTFVPYLGSSMSSPERIALSRHIYNVLKNPKVRIIGESKGRRHVVDPDVLEICKTPQTDHKTIQKLTEKLEDKIRKHLPKIGDDHVIVVREVIIRRALQQTYIKRDPDAHMDVEKLLDRALTGTYEILETLCNVRKKQAISSKIIVQAPANTFSSKESASALQEKLKNIACKGLQDLQTTHYLLKTLSGLYYQEGKKGIELASDSFLQTAQQLENSYPFVSQNYYQKATKGYKRLPHCREKLISVAQKTQTLLGTLGLTEMGNESYIDEDSLSQLVHLESGLPTLKYACFKATLKPNDRNLNVQIHNQIVEMIIKIHHLLDQSFTRFANALIYEPGEKGQVHFPCIGSEKALIEKLTSDGLFNQKKRSLADYPKLFARLKGSQPFSGESWWAIVYALSVEAKHVRMQLNHGSDLLLESNVAKLEEFYQIPFSPNRLFGWSFKEFGSIELSEKIIQRLTERHYLSQRKMDEKSKAKLKEDDQVKIIAKTTGKVNYKSPPFSLKLYIKAIREGANPNELKSKRRAAFINLKKALNGIKLTDKNIEKILDQLIHYLKKSMGDLTIQSGRRIEILKVLGEAIKETRFFVEAFFGAIRDAKPSEKLSNKPS